MNEISRAYIENKGSFEAWEPLDELCRSDPSQALDIIIEINANTDCPQTISVLAAGPLEDLLACNGKKVIERVGVESRRNPKFRHLLGGVWENTIERSVWDEVQRLRGEIIW